MELWHEQECPLDMSSHLYHNKAEKVQGGQKLVSCLFGCFFRTHHCTRKDSCAQKLFLYLFFGYTVSPVNFYYEHDGK